ncbi:MAG: hypothetical protein ACLPUG_13720 [Acidimicrobiales bacterium]
MALRSLPAVSKHRRPLAAAIATVPVDGEWHTLAQYATPTIAANTAQRLRWQYRVNAVARGCQVLVNRGSAL